MGMVHSLDQGLAHQRRRTGHAIEPSERDHFQDRIDAAPLRPHQPARSVLKLHFRGGVAPVPQLILEALDRHSIARTAG